jgi:hypothetical protein
VRSETAISRTILAQGGIRESSHRGGELDAKCIIERRNSRALSSETPGELRESRAHSVGEEWCGLNCRKSVSYLARAASRTGPNRGHAPLALHHYATFCSLSGRKTNTNLPLRPLW